MYVNPLKHQQGIWSQSSLQQYFLLYPWILSTTPRIDYLRADSFSSLLSINLSLSSTSLYSSLLFRKYNDSIKERSKTKYDTSSGIYLNESQFNKYLLINLLDKNLLTSVPYSSEVDHYH